MSRFGTTARFKYDPGDTYAGGTSVILSEADMPQYPFDTVVISDSQEIRTKSGERYEYENWNKKQYTFSWVNLSESKRDELFDMVNSLPILTFRSPDTASGTWTGTFRAPRTSWSDSETSFERYDVSFMIEEE